MPHVSTVENSLGVSLVTDDGEGLYDMEKGFWEVAWRWQAGEPPTSAIGSGITEYSWRRLSSDQEEKFQSELDLWIR